MSRVAEWPDRGWVRGFAWPAHLPGPEAALSAPPAADDEVAASDRAQLATFRVLWSDAAARLMAALVRGFAGNGALALRLLAPGS